MPTIRIPAFLVLAAATLLLAACNFGKFAYNHASPLVTYMADDYFDLSNDQEEFVRTRFGRLQSWHRSTQLPEYERFLREALARTERPITVADAHWVNTTARDYYHKMVEHSLSDVADLLLQLDASHARHFEERWTRETEKIERETAKGSREARVEKAAKKLTDQIETYTGKLSGDQRTLVASRVYNLPDIAQMRLADRRQRQELITALVRARPAKPEMIAGLRHALIDTDKWRKPEFIAATKQRDEQYAQLAEALSATLTAEQRSSVQKKVRNYLSDISSLIVSR